MRRPERPSSVRIGGYEFSIEWPDADLTMPSGDKAVGHSSYHQLTLQVCTNYPLPMQQDTLLHEILHSINETNSTSNWWKSVQSDPNGDFEEALVSSTTPVLLAVLRDNPHVLKWLTYAEPTRITVTPA
jgi:hypothetical protein